MKFYHFLPTLRKSLASPRKFYYCPPLVHNVWLITDNCWTAVLWSGSTKLCNKLRKHFRWFTLKYFFGLDIKSLIDLKIFGATFGIGVGNCPHCPPKATCLHTTYMQWIAYVASCQILLFQFNAVKQRWALGWTWIGLDPVYDEFCWFWFGSRL